MKRHEKNPMEDSESGNVIVATFRDWKTETSLDFKFTHSNHSSKRAKQRGMYGEKLSMTLAYGEPIYKQGLLYYILGEKNFPDEWKKKKGKIRNMVVVVSGTSDRVVTCYRSKNPFKHIKKKSKILYTNCHAA
jgi:hypothetical protein